MKKPIGIGFSCLVLSLVCAVGSLAQTRILKNDFERLSFAVELNKTGYLPLEPIFVHLKLSNKTNEDLSLQSRPIFTRLSVTVSFGDQSKTFGNLFLLSQPRPSLSVSMRKDESIEGNVVLEKMLDEIFTQYGHYEIQFVLDDGTGTQIMSDVKAVNIYEPTGTNKEAVDFLRKNQNKAFLWWKSSSERENISRNGRPLIEEFTARFSETVFGEYAHYQLGLHYMNGRETEKAKIEFEKIKYSENPVIATEAQRNLDKLGH